MKDNEAIEHKITDPEPDGTQRCVFCDLIITKPEQTAFEKGAVYQYDDEARGFGKSIASYITAIKCTQEN